MASIVRYLTFCSYKEQNGKPGWTIEPVESRQKVRFEFLSARSRGAVIASMEI
jgi:hypothetical protein